VLSTLFCFYPHSSFGVLVEAQRLSLPAGSVGGLRRLCAALVFLIASCIELGVWSNTAGFPMNAMRCTFSILTMILNFVTKSKTQGWHTSTIIYRLVFVYLLSLFSIE
jgi:hypothetical protein